MLNFYSKSTAFLKADVCEGCDKWKKEDRYWSCQIARASVWPVCRESSKTYRNCPYNKVGSLVYTVLTTAGSWRQILLRDADPDVLGSCDIFY